ncbi:MAG TPA: AraC family transcriptional regulator [Saprospiraceae bacterium]|nr:AraC family transcriptional regulator [Saprospiraceae bacterium]HMQ83670.1 AraC family transcriptional regulator [Saprospiraceae bacterium]
MTMMLANPIRRMGDYLNHVELNFDDVVIHSRLKHFEKRVEDSGLSIKLGVQGEEHFIINRDRLTIGEGRFLIVNRHQTFDCELHAREPVEALCIYLSQEALNQAQHALFNTLDQQLGNFLPDTKPAQAFLEKIYHVSENRLGRFLEQQKTILLNQHLSSTIDWPCFYQNLAENLLLTQFQTESMIEKITSARRATREELFRRLCIAHQFILDNYESEIDLDTLAQKATISKFHLLRTYRETFGTTPYRQVLDLRLERSRQLLQADYSLEEIAFQLGFSDRRAFTKAFRKTFQQSPSSYRKRKKQAVPV